MLSRTISQATRTATGLALAAAALGLPGSPAAAQTRSQVYGSQLVQQAQTVYVRADAGMTTYESQAADSKETKGSMTYNVGGWFGENRSAGLSVTSSDQNVHYSLNDAQTKMSFEDVRAMVRLGWLTPSLGVSLSEVQVQRGGEQTVSLIGTGVNAGLGLQVPISSSIVVYGDALTVRTTKDFDKVDDTTKLGNRNEADAGVSFDVTDKMVDFLIGYRVRGYDIKTQTGVFKERSEGAYAGLRFGLYF